MHCHITLSGRVYGQSRLFPYIVSRCLWPELKAISNVWFLLPKEQLKSTFLWFLVKQSSAALQGSILQALKVDTLFFYSKSEQLHSKSFMCYAFHIYLGFSNFLQVHFTLPFFSRTEMVRFQLPSRTSPDQKEGAAVPGGRYCLSVVQQDRRSPTGGAGISENGIKPSTQLLYFLTNLWDPQQKN